MNLIANGSLFSFLLLLLFLFFFVVFLNYFFFIGLVIQVGTL